MKKLAVKLLINVHVARKPTPMIVATLTKSVHTPPTPTPHISSTSIATMIHNIAVRYAFRSARLRMEDENMPLLVPAIA